jgi:hypothetical protein
MRKQLDEYIVGGGEGLSPLVISALAPKAKGKAKAKA